MIHDNGLICILAKHAPVLHGVTAMPTRPLQQSLGLR